MPKLRYLKVQFATPLHAAEVPYFRAAVIEATRRQSALFHNHTPESGSIYRYPLIQYKVLHRRAAMVCLEQGTDDIHYLFQQPSLELRIGQATQLFEIEDIHLRYFQVQCWQQHFYYNLKNWLPLNQHHYTAFNALETELERIQYLEKLLTGNLLAFAKGIGWDTEHQLELAITRIHGTRWLPFKQHKQLAFSVDFRCNASLPDFVGLGKGGSIGFGCLRGVESQKGNRNDSGQHSAQRPPLSQPAGPHSDTHLS